MRRLGWLLLGVALLVTRAESQILTGGAAMQRANPVTAAQGGHGADFSASTGIHYVAAGTFSSLACTASTTLLVGGAPPACTATPSGLTSLGAGTLTATTSATIGGATPTAITNIRVYAPSLTPTSIVIGIGAVEQTFTVTGLTTADKVIVNPPSGLTVLCPLTAFRVSATDTLALTFGNLAVAACSPGAGVYNVVAIRS